MNKSIKRALIIIPSIALAGIFATGAVMADGKGCHHSDTQHTDQKSYAYKGGKQGHKMVRRIANSLDLTEAQEGTIKHIMKSQHKGALGDQRAMAAQLIELRQLESGTDAYIAMATAIGTLHGQDMAQRLIERANVEAQIVDVLTPEQAEQYQAMRDEMADKRAEHM